MTSQQLKWFSKILLELSMKLVLGDPKHWCMWNSKKQLIQEISELAIHKNFNIGYINTTVEKSCRNYTKGFRIMPGSQVFSKLGEVFNVLYQRGRAWKTIVNIVQIWLSGSTIHSMRGDFTRISMDDIIQLCKLAYHINKDVPTILNK